MNRVAPLLLPLMIVLPLVGRAAEGQAASPLEAKVDVPQAKYQSPFAGYRGFREQPLRTWHDSNELVFKLGGWKAFASGQVPQVDEPGASPRQEAAPATKPAQDHAGHGARK